ncbi:MAG: hypothetical protein AAB393_07730 [Bacteroidota bacterium]
MKLLAGAAVLVLLNVAVHHMGYACPNCYGDPESSATEGMNMAIVTLLGITGSVLAGFVGFFIFLWRRIRHLNRQFVSSSN